MENQKKNIFLSNWEFFVWNWEKNILFGIWNGAEFRPQNRVIESPVFTWDQKLFPGPKIRLGPAFVKLGCVDYIGQSDQLIEGASTLPKARLSIC